MCGLSSTKAVRRTMQETVRGDEHAGEGDTTESSEDGVSEDTAHHAAGLKHHSVGNKHPPVSPEYYVFNYL